eukprot:768248-Hanusia_phi.AAC.2
MFHSTCSNCILQFNLPTTSLSFMRSSLTLLAHEPSPLPSCCPHLESFCFCFSCPTHRHASSPSPYMLTCLQTRDVSDPPPSLPLPPLLLLPAPSFC